VVFLHGVEIWQPLVGRKREALLRASLLIANSSSTVAATRAVNPWIPSVEVMLLWGSRRPRSPSMRVCCRRCA